MPPAASQRRTPGAADGPLAGPFVRLFGPGELVAGSGVLRLARERRFQLLAVLAVRAGEWITRDQLAALFWPEHGNAEARRNLRKVIFDARGVEGAHTLEAGAQALRWGVDSDLQAFERALAEGRHAEALALRRGPLLDGLEDAASPTLGAWLAAERARWDNAWRDLALHRLAPQADATTRAGLAQQLLVADPLDEEAVGVLVDAHLALGLVAQARRVFDDYAARLAEALAVEPARALRERFAAAADRVAAARGAAAGTGPAAAPDRTSAAAALAPDDGFVGRRTELAELRAMLARPECRLVTITGPGGVGKSRLARRALADVAPAAPALWIELADLADDAAVSGRLAQQLGIELDVDTDPVDLLGRALAAGPTLLALDNAEHLPGLAALVDRWLAAAPRLQVLVTSRTRLHGAAEWLLPLGGLAVPDEDSRDLEAARVFDAVRLFELRARAATREFDLAADLDAVIAIVEAVDGLPLAIDLAAAWVRLLPTAEIARDLHESLDLLERDPARGAADARPGHASMRIVLERSWSLLAPQERDALTALSVFRGGFGHAAAQQVAGVRLPLLSSLVDKSLLAVDAGGRFGMHPLVAVEAAHRRDAEGARAPALRLRHAEYFARHLAALEPHTRGDPRRLVAGLDAEFGNCLVAWQHAVALARFDLVAAMTPALWSFFDNRGRVREGIALLTPALALPEAGAAAQRAQARLRNGLAWLLHRSGDLDRALTLARAGLAAAIACEDLDAQVGCDVAIGACLWQLGRMEEGRVHYERAVRVARAAGLRQPLAYALGNLGVALFELGESQAAIAATEQAIAGCRDVGDQFNVGAYLVNLGTMWRDLGDPVQAREVLQRADRHCAEFGLHAVRMYVALSLGPLLAAAGQADAGRRLLDGAVETARRTGMRWVEWDARRGLVRVDLQEHDFDRALARLAGVAREARELGATHDLVCALRLHGRMLARIGRVGDARALWQMLAAHPAAFPREKVGLAADIAALPAGAAEPIGFDAALDRLVAEAEASARAAKR